MGSIGPLGLNSDALENIHNLAPNGVPPRRKKSVSVLPSKDDSGGSQVNISFDRLHVAREVKQANEDENTKNPCLHEKPPPCFG
jgi:hypothetical protein